MFSIGIFKSNFKRFWIVPVIATLIIFLTITFQMVIELEDRKQIYNYSYDTVPINVQEYTTQSQSNNLTNTASINNITNTIVPYNPIEEEVPNNIITDTQAKNITKYLTRTLYSTINILIIFTIPVITSILLFSYINEEKSSSFIHGLPISKKRLYITNIITGIAMSILPYLINLVLLLIINLGDMGNYLQNVEIFKWFGICTLYSTMFFGFSTIVGTICASKISHGILTYVLMYAPLGLIVLLNQVIEKLLYGFNGILGDVENLAMKLPFIKIIEIFAEMSYYTIGDTINLKFSQIIIYIVAFIIMLLLGYWIYKKRKLEVTKEFIAFDFIRSIVKYCATLCVTLLSSSYFYFVFDEQKLPTIIGTIIITAIAYFIIEMILKKTYKVLKSAKGLIIYVVIMLVGYSLLENGLFGFETKIPKVDEVKEVAITKYNETIVFDEKENVLNIINLHSKVVEERLQGYTTYTIKYTLNDGSKISRKYQIKEKEYQSYLDKLVDSDEYLEEKMKFLNKPKDIENIEINLTYYSNSYKYSNYKTITIEEADKNEFIKCLKEDLRARRAIFESNLIEATNKREEGEIISLRVDFELKDNKREYVSYNTKDVQNSKITKYIQK